MQSQVPPCTLEWLRMPMRWWRAIALLAGFSAVSPGAELVRDEDARLRVLAALLPGTHVISAQRRVPEEPAGAPGAADVIEFPDALQGERAYRVRGKPLDERERCAAEDIMVQRIASEERELRLVLYGVALADGSDGYVAVAQYAFVGANPAMACPRIARFALLTRTGPNWQLVDTFDADTTHHSGINSLAFHDTDGDGVEEFIVESDWGGAGVHGASLMLFDISRAILRELISVESRVRGGSEVEERLIRTLDLGRTVREKGRRFCFTETVYESKGRWLKPPHVSHPCFARGKGVRASSQVFQPR